MTDMYKEKNPLPVVLIALFKGNKILLAKRKREPYSGFYGILGGRQTFGMLTEDVVKKEVLEETGFHVRNETINTRGLYSEILLDSKNEPKHHFLFRVCEAYLDDKKDRNLDIENTDIESFKWFDLPLSDEIRKKIIPSDLIFLDHILSDTKHDFKEIVMKERDDNKLDLLEVR
jgi:8-oxo-dGTP pyrophosphatase MutT (NUDIX family)